VVPAGHQVEKYAISPSSRLRRISRPWVQRPSSFVAPNSAASRSASSRYAQSYSRGPLVPSPAERHRQAGGWSRCAMSAAVPLTTGSRSYEWNGWSDATPST
jgi:hypothetical protein